MGNLNKLLATGLMAGLAGLGVGCEKTAEKEMPKAVTISVGDVMWFEDYSTLGYNGMIGKDTFSISVGYEDSGVNNYFPADAKKIKFRGQTYEIQDLTTQTITIRRTE